MPARSVRLMFAILAAPVAAMGLAQAAQAAPDRYGAPIYAPPEAAEAAPSVYLNWPGKTPSVPSIAPAVSPAPVTLAGGPPPGQAMAPANIYDRPPARPVSRLRIQTDARAAQVAHLLRQAEPIGSARPTHHLRVATRVRSGHVTRIIRIVQVVREAPETAASRLQPQPVQIAAVQPVAAPVAAAQPNPQPAAIAANGLAPRFYSVHRQFGVQPDPIPLPAQFFGDSPATDLAAAPAPLPPRVILGQGASSTASVQRAVAAANLAAGDANTSN